MQRWEKAAVKSQTSLSMLNVGQSALIAIAVVADHLARDGRRDRRHDVARRPRARQRVHDPALHPAQLPRRDLSRDQAERWPTSTACSRCSSSTREVADDPGAKPLPLARRRDRGTARGRASSTSTSATTTSRQILFDVDFEIGAGQTVAVVGPSRLRQVDARAAAVPLLRRQRRARSRSPARTSATSRSRRCARRSASSRRTRCCSTTRSATTSATAAPAARRVDARRDRGGREGGVHPRLRAERCPTATRRRSASAG